jgi:hypothetical protein
VPVCTHPSLADDANGDNEMDENEAKVIILDSLTALQRWLPKMHVALARVNMQAIDRLYSKSAQASA